MANPEAFTVGPKLPKLFKGKFITFKIFTFKTAFCVRKNLQSKKL